MSINQVVTRLTHPNQSLPYVTTHLAVFNCKTLVTFDLRPTPQVGSSNLQLPSTRASKPFPALTAPESRQSNLRFAPASADLSNLSSLLQDSNVESHAEVHPRAALSLNALIYFPFVLFLEGTWSWQS